MDPPPRPTSASLFQVYLRLRPPPSSLVQPTQQSLYPLLAPPERFLTVEPPSLGSQNDGPTHITIHPPSDSRKRAVEKFAFTRVFEEGAAQLDIFNGTGVVSLVEGIVGEGRDGLLATLGVTGSGKSHTILGSKSQRGLTQLSLDLLYRSLGSETLHPTGEPSLISSLVAADASEAQVLPASSFLDAVYGDYTHERGASRAPTPMTVGRDSYSPQKAIKKGGLYDQWSILGLRTSFRPLGVEEASSNPSATSSGYSREHPAHLKNALPSQLPVWNTSSITRKVAKTRFGGLMQDSGFTPTTRRNLPQRPSGLPQFPDISDIRVSTQSNTEYAMLVSMYEVYNDRIFDLLSNVRNPKDHRRRPLLFKSTESSPDRKVVAGLRKIVCGSYEEALMVLETGLMERRVAGTGSNSVSSRSHGFFCVDVKRRSRATPSSDWSSAQLTLVDLAGSERARNAKTAGATLAEAGKINESLMYLGQCLQMQSDCHDMAKPSIVPYRQCKLTELLFSNSFPSSSHSSTHAHHQSHHKNPQKAIMIVTADPIGDYNASTQILRYSALAREVTVPRIPSITSTILSGIPFSNKSQPSSSGRTTPIDSVIAAELDLAAAEIARLTEEVEILQLRLVDEQDRRKEAEENWQRAEELAEAVERDVREECWAEMETRIDEERRRWMAAWGDQADRNDEHLDRKLDILSKGIIPIHQDEPPTTNPQRVAELEDENASLRARLDVLERDALARSPTRRPATTRASGDAITSALRGMTLGERQPPSWALKTPGKQGQTPGKKVRKLTARKWDLADENELIELEGSP